MRPKSTFEIFVQAFIKLGADCSFKLTTLIYLILTVSLKGIITIISESKSDYT